MLDPLFEFQLDIFRLDAGIRRDVLGILNNLESELVADLKGQSLDNIGRARANELLRQSNATIEKFYTDAQLELLNSTKDLARVTATSTKAALDTALVVDLGVRLPSNTVMSSIASQAVIDGAVTKAWWAKQEADVAFRYAGAVRQGLAAAETNQQIVRRVRSVMDISRRNAASLVQTSVATVANDARFETYKANDEFIDRYVWITALDTRVCKLCIARADKAWKPDGTPIGHSIPFTNPPIHFRDRCLLVGEPKTFKQLGLDIDEPPVGTRASMDGQVSANTTFESFMKRKGEGFQNKVLGKGRVKLWKDGKIDLEELINGDGNPLTITELTKLHAGTAKSVAAVSPIHKEALSYVQDIGKRRNIESALIYNPKTGKEVFRKTGDRSSVGFLKDETAKMRGNILVHNHPGTDEANLSFGDFNTAGIHGLKSVVAVTPKGTQFIGSASGEVSQFAYERAINEARNIVSEFKSKGFSADDSSTMFGHAMNLSLSKTKIINYSVETPSADFTRLITDNKQFIDEAVTRIAESIKRG